MKIKISGGSLWISTHYFELQFDLNGSGTIDDPFLFSNNKTYYDDDLEYSIFDSSSYIKFNNILWKSLYLARCKNIIISNVEFTNLALNQCSRVLIQNAKITKQLKIVDSHVIKFADCNIKKLSAYSGDHILFSNCNVKRISKDTEALIQTEQSRLNKIMRKYKKNIHGKNYTIERTLLD